MKNHIYLDYAATTPVTQTVLETMLPYFCDHAGNASSVYATGREARKAVEIARKQVAEAVGAEPGEIYFTSCGSESDNFAIKGTGFALQESGKNIITTAIEHPAVLNTCRWLEKHGFSVTYLMPDRDGRITPEQIRNAIRKDTILISVMAANNEIGTIEPIAEIGKEAKAEGILFHTDAVQAVGAIPVNVREWNVDLLSLSAHKFGGPKGVGALYIRRGTRMDPLIHGGKQEHGLRAGTENTPSIVGMGKAIEDAVLNMDESTKHVTKLRDLLTDGILSSVPNTFLNGPKTGRLPNNCNICFDRIDGEALLLRLDLAGIAASSGSACTAGTQETSHVLTAIGLNENQAKGSLRLTVGTENTEEEINITIRTIREIVSDLRALFHEV